MLMIGLAVGVAATYGVYRVPARQQTMDHNGDGAWRERADDIVSYLGMDSTEFEDWVDSMHHQLHH